ncbi:MAG: adenine phosphoribosyltransferase [Planctomycetia bacterium]
MGHGTDERGEIHGRKPTPCAGRRQAPCRRRIVARLDAIAAVEARGFLFATPLALELGVGVIPVRKPGKLPADTIEHEYDLEDGRERLQMHRNVLPAGARVLVVDDVLATGGTAAACMKLIEAGGGKVAGAAFLIEIEPLGGRERLAPHRVEATLTY